MMRSRALIPALFALVILATDAAPARADLATGWWPWSKSNSPRSPRYLRHLTDEQKTGEVEPPKPPPEMYPDDRFVGPPPKRTGPFRSCGSGTPAALAGIGAAWAMLWLGNRFVRATRCR